MRLLVKVIRGAIPEAGKQLRPGAGMSRAAAEDEHKREGVTFKCAFPANRPGQ